MVKCRMRVLYSGLGGLFGLVLASAAAGQAVAKPPGPAPSVALREIDDPHSGARWFLVKAEEHPGGPGRLIQFLVPLNPGEPGGPAPAPAMAAIKRQIVMPIVRAGDRVLVEEHTERVDAVLEAVALGPAAESGLLQARLKVGGRVVSAIAVAPGRVRLSAGTEAGR